jgi:hypothetical protein
MNISLKKEIIKHIFNNFGLFKTPETKFALTNTLRDDSFLLDKRIIFLGEEDKKIQNKCWAVISELGKSKMKVLIADITDDIEEFAIIMKMDNFPIYALRLSSDSSDAGHLMIKTDKKWIDTSTAIQARCLFGIEGIADTYLEWKKLIDYQELYDALIGFIKQIES